MTEQELREIAAKATPVVGWYPHGPGDGYHPGKASVRGPFGRWLIVEGGDNGMGDPVKYPTPVAPLEDDAKFAAAAMNSLVPLLDENAKLRAALKAIKKENCFIPDGYVRLSDEIDRIVDEALSHNDYSLEEK